MSSEDAVAQQLRQGGSKRAPQADGDQNDHVADHVGRCALKISMMGIRLILLQAFRHMPTGGVTRPMARPVIIMAPNCSGEKPYCTMTGSRMGVSSRMAGLTSMKVPIIRISTSKISAMAHAGMFRDMKKAPTVCGTFCMVSTHVKMVVKPMMSMMEEEEIRVFFKASQTPFHVSSL